MFILGDESKSNGKLPWVTFCLVAINVVAYCAQCFLGDSLTRGFALVPREISSLTDLTKPEQLRAKVPARIWYDKGKQKIQFREVNLTVPQAPGPFPIFLTLLTSMFLHGDWLHLLSNMWFLAVFGRNVECALDHGRFFAFYIACGVVGGLVYTVSDLNSVIPCLGASGAISGVMGAYVAIHPLNLISIWFGWFIGVIELPAIVVVGAWFLLQYVAAFQAFEYQGTSLGGTAYWDHVGGFLAGVGIIWATIAYLKWQVGHKPAEVDDEPAPPSEAAILAPDDPFDNFLPETSKRHQQNQITANTFLPSNTGVKSMDK